MRNREGMRTQQPHRLDRARGLRAVAPVALAALLGPAGAAFAQDGGAGSGSEGGPSTELLLGGAAVLLVAAALIGYGVPAVRRRRALRHGAGVSPVSVAPLLGPAPVESLGGPAGWGRGAAMPPRAQRGWAGDFTQTGRPSPNRAALRPS